MSSIWSESNVTSVDWRASLGPAAAVTPAPIAYVKVATAKRTVVVYLLRLASSPAAPSAPSRRVPLRFIVRSSTLEFYFEEMGLLKQANALNTLAWK